MGDCCSLLSTPELAHGFAFFPPWGLALPPCLAFVSAGSRVFCPCVAATGSRPLAESARLGRGGVNRASRCCPPGREARPATFFASASFPHPHHGRGRGVLALRPERIAVFDNDVPNASGSEQPILYAQPALCHRTVPAACCRKAGRPRPSNFRWFARLPRGTAEAGAGDGDDRADGLGGEITHGGA